MNGSGGLVQAGVQQLRHRVEVPGGGVSVRRPQIEKPARIVSKKMSLVNGLRSTTALKLGGTIRA